MFHLMLALPAIIVLAIVASLILFSIVAITSAFIGGTTVALLVKNATAKKLLFIGFCILFLTGFLFVSPFIIGLLNLPATAFTIVSVCIYICIMILTIAGIKTSSSSVSNKIGKLILIVVFCIILIAAISLMIITALTSFILLRA